MEFIRWGFGSNNFIINIEILESHEKQQQILLHLQREYVRVLVALFSIKESIEEYSQNFEKDSHAQSRYQQSIAEDISVSRTNKLASQSLNQHNLSKKNLKPQPQQPPPSPPIK